MKLTRVGSSGSEKLRYGTEEEEVEIGKRRSTGVRFAQPHLPSTEQEVLQLLEELYPAREENVSVVASHPNVRKRAYSELKDRIRNEDESRSEAAEESGDAVSPQDVENRLPHAETLLDDFGRGSLKRVDGRSDRSANRLASLSVNANFSKRSAEG